MLCGINEKRLSGTWPVHNQYMEEKKQNRSPSNKTTYIIASKKAENVFKIYFNMNNVDIYKKYLCLDTSFYFYCKMLILSTVPFEWTLPTVTIKSLGCKMIEMQRYVDIF